MRAHMRNITLEQPQDDSIAASVGMTDQSIREMYRLMAIAKYDERYVIPKAHVEQAHELEELGCSLDFDGGPYEQGPFGEASGRPSPVAVETFQALRQRQTSDVSVSGAELQGRVNLLNWDGKGHRRECSPNAGSRRESPAPRGDPRRVVRQAAAVCLGYPERDVIARSGLLRAALAEEPPGQAESFEPLLAFWDSRIPQRSRPTTSMSSICHESTASTCRTGPMAIPGDEARYWPRSNSATAALASWSTPGASCPTTCRWCWSMRRSSTQSTGLPCCRSTGAAWSCSGWLSRNAARRTPGC